MKRLLIKRNTYQDSFNLMLLANQVQKLPGVNEVALLMGTSANQKRLEKAGYSFAERVEPNDLIIALDLQSEDYLQATLQKVDLFLTDGRVLAGGSARGQAVLPRSLEGALQVFHHPDLVSISLPGEYAGQEARKALQSGLHVFLFSDNVSIQEEISLKQLAWEKGLLLMGPDCGTARIGSVSFGFCNRVNSGDVGIVAASGTGAQEAMSLLDRYGVGVSHVIGTGGRDLDAQVGAVSSIMGLLALEADPSTKVILYISKPAGRETSKKLLQLAGSLKKPLVFCFIGEPYEGLASTNGWVKAANLDHAAQLAASFLTGEVPAAPLTLQDIFTTHQEQIVEKRAKLDFQQKYMRGLFSGGSLADEAALILAQVLPEVHAGNGFGNVLPISDWEKSSGNLILDMGDDRFTQGRPHPMIDFRTRLERLRAEASDPSVAVILLDLVLGLNVHPDPASELAPVIEQIQAENAGKASSPIFLFHVCGTDQDPQNFTRQVERLEQAGCWVFDSNAQAAMAAACLVSPRIEDTSPLP